MKIIVIGASGTIGSAIVSHLADEHSVVKVGNRSGDYTVDLASESSIENLFRAVGSFDAVVSAAGMARFGAMAELTQEDYVFGLTHKLMGQVNLFRIGRNFSADNVSFTLTSGTLSRHPLAGSSSVSMVNSAVEGFVRAAALECENGLRINAVSPGWVKETMEKLGMDSSAGTPAAKVALAYHESIFSLRNGEIIDA